MGKILNAMLAVSILTVPLPGQTPAPAAQGKAPEVRVTDNKISIQAEAVPLGRLLRLLDLATGMTSTVANDVTNRNVYVRFSDLDFNAAVRKIFEGQSLDYVVLSGKGIQVRGASEPPSTSTASSSPTTSFSPPPIQDPPFVNNGPPLPQQPTPAAGAPQGNQPPNASAPVPAAVRPANAPQPNVPAPTTPPGAIPMYTPGAAAPASGGTTAPAPAAPTTPPLGNGALPVFNPTAR